MNSGRVPSGRKKARLWWVSWWSSLTGREESIITEKPVGSVVRKASGYVIAEGMLFAFVHLVLHSITIAAQLDKEKPNARLSDGKVDPPEPRLQEHDEPN